MSDLITRHLCLYKAEKDANTKMLAALESVPETARSNPRFARALTLAEHIRVARQRILVRLTGGDPSGLDPFPENVPLEDLRERFAETEAGWIAYLASLTTETLTETVSLPRGDGSFVTFPKEAWLDHLALHAPYHRGQVHLLIDELGGETINTDYILWITNQTQ